MENNNWLTTHFEATRGHLQAVAYRMLGSRTEAEDAVQGAWIRLNRSDSDTIDNLRLAYHRSGQDLPRYAPRPQSGTRGFARRDSG